MCDETQRCKDYITIGWVRIKALSKGQWDSIAPYGWVGWLVVMLGLKTLPCSSRQALIMFHLRKKIQYAAWSSVITYHHRTHGHLFTRRCQTGKSRIQWIIRIVHLVLQCWRCFFRTLDAWKSFEKPIHVYPMGSIYYIVNKQHIYIITWHNFLHAPYKSIKCRLT